MSVQRRVSIASYLLLSRRAGSPRPRRAQLGEPWWRRWYVPWLGAIVALIGLVVAGLAALDILTATLETRPPMVPSDALEHVEELAPGSKETIGPQP
ncbi:MAG TPA: hypothetical protein VJS92_09185 [Candidatus Polarisedimenticolaceae bacterium]|nr:hypothetical protein [Candidatus Polarisedimenticolaceae bacterium]